MPIRGRRLLGFRRKLEKNQIVRKYQFDSSFLPQKSFKKCHYAGFIGFFHQIKSPRLDLTSKNQFLYRLIGLLLLQISKPINREKNHHHFYPVSSLANHLMHQ
jgi:hypothetical protein